MPLPLKTLAFCAAVLGWAPAQAQFLGFGFESNIELTKADLDIIHSTVDAEVHGKAVGATASWNNPASKNYGSIKLLKKYTLNGHPCETVEYTLATKRVPVRPEHYMLNSCRQPDGQWRII